MSLKNSIKRSGDVDIVATFYGADRRNSSANGNPSWTFRTDQGDLKMQTDAALGYEVTNHTGRPEHSTESWIGQKVRFRATKAGRVYAWELAEES